MDKWTIEFHPDASDEAEAANNWYAERSLLASRSFVSELIHAVDQVVEAPEMWPLYEAGTRRYVFPRFPFSFVYRILEKKIQIVAVAHSKRKPGYWKSRYLNTIR
ncbi:MAG TPA: type II toxin-antitoxin system RelE/ParE family toxin [Desulfobacterales bacterium]|nr:type II toxin-antitoxin system RelE/ParE family toxin [Desulfobacterales bacterium]